MSTCLSSILAFTLLFVNQQNPLNRPQVSAKPDIKSTVGCTDIPDAEKLPPPGPSCEKELFTRRGQPFMFPARDGHAFGISSSSNKPSELYIWVDNQTDQASVGSHLTGPLFYEMIDIFDSNGHRVLSKVDQAEQKARLEGKQIVQVTDYTFDSIPAHTIQIVDHFDISLLYTLPPGHYTIAERNPPAPINLEPNPPHVPPGLAISFP